MYNATVIANKFVELSFYEKSYFTHMKLQKLTYIANGISLAINNQPLINEHFEAWPYCPVVSSVYHTYKVFGNTNITINAFKNYNSIINLDEKSNQAFKDAWKIGKTINAIKLSNWTRIKGSPWFLAKSEKLEVVPYRYMQDYFKKFLVKKL